MSRYDDDDYEKTDQNSEESTKKQQDDDDDRPVRRWSDVKDEDDDDEDVVKDDTPARRVIRSGWGAVDQVKNSDSPFAQKLKVTEEPIVIKFLEDEPYASFRQHWVERSGQKSFTCISDIDDRGCPLCDMGNRPATRFAFNVVQLTDGDPVIKSYEVGPRVIDQLKNFHTDPRQGPLSKHYWAVSRTGKGTTSATHHQMIKERDLDDEWKVEALTEADFKSLRKKIYSADIIPIPKRKDLLNIAAEES